MTDQLPNNDQSENEGKKSPDAEMLDDVKALPEKQKQDFIAKLEMYSGPIPHPEILKGYQKLYEDAPKRIIENGIAESEHRRELETERQRNRQLMARRAMRNATLISIMLIIISAFLIYFGHSIVGSILGGGSFISIVGSLINQSEQLTKNDDLNSDNEKKD